jgi:hypothetical protein
MSFAMHVKSQLGIAENAMLQNPSLPCNRGSAPYATDGALQPSKCSVHPYRKPEELPKVQCSPETDKLPDKKPVIPQEFRFLPHARGREILKTHRPSHQHSIRIRESSSPPGGDGTAVAKGSPQQTTGNRIGDLQQ